MFQLTRKVTASITLIAMAWSASAVNIPSEAIVNQRKEEAIASIADVSINSEATARSGVLLGLRLDGDSRQGRARLQLDGDVLWDAFAMDGGRRVVLDLHNAISLLPQENAVPHDRRIIRRILTSQHALEPLYVSRIVFDVGYPVTTHVQDTANGLEVVFTAQPGEFGDSHQPLDVPSNPAREARRAQIAALEMRETQHRAWLTQCASSRAFGHDFRPFFLGSSRQIAVETDLYPALDTALDMLTEQDLHTISEFEAAKTENDASIPVFQSIDLANIDLRLMDTTKLATTSSPLPEAPVADTRTDEGPMERTETAQVVDMPDIVDAVDAAENEASADMPEPITTVEEPPDRPVREAVTIPQHRDVPTRIGGATDPLYQPVVIDFRDMELSNVVALLAEKADINVIAGPEVSLTTPVSAYLQNVPLLTAMETVLRMSDLGVIEEEDIFRIVPYAEAVEARRTTRMIHVHKANVEDLESTLSRISGGMPDGRLVMVTADRGTSSLIITGPKNRVEELEELAYQLDVQEALPPTITRVIKLNYSEPTEIVPLVESSLSPEIGYVEIDQRSRHIIVTDLPLVIEKIEQLIKEIDLPVKQVAIEAMIVDAVLRDSSQTGVNWLLDLVRKRDRQGNVIGNLEGRRTPDGDIRGSIRDMNISSQLGNIGSESLNAGILSFGVLSSNFDFRGAIAAEAASTNADILATPIVVTAENKEANISIVQEFPYQEITQSTQGPPIASTAFKDIGIELQVTPRVTHNNEIMVDLTAKQSSVTGLTPDGIPIEDKRSAETSLLTGNGQTIFLGGLRDVSNRHDLSKIPILGDVPVLNFLFRTTDVESRHTELMIFLTCHVIEHMLPELTPSQQVKFDQLQDVPDVPNAQRDMFRSIVRPGEMRDPIWKWRRTP